MQDIKKRYGWTRDEDWPSISFVSVPGNPKAGRVISRWRKVAVLEINAGFEAFYIGFRSGNIVKMLRHAAVATDTGRFGMRIGPDDVDFFVIPVNREMDLELTLIEVTDIRNPDYEDLPLY